MPNFLSYPTTSFAVQVAPASTLAGTATEKIVTGMQLILPPSILRAGTMFKIHYSATLAASRQCTFQIRCGTAGTTADALVIPGTASASGTGIFLDSYISIGASGSSGNISGYMNVCALTTAGSGGSGTPGIYDTGTTPAAINTGTQNYLSLTLSLSSSTTVTNRVAYIETLY